MNKCILRMKKGANKTKARKQMDGNIQNKAGLSKVKIERKTMIVICVSLLAAIMIATAGILYCCDAQKTSRFSDELLAFQQYCEARQLGDMKTEYGELIEEAELAIAHKKDDSYETIEKEFESFKVGLDEYLIKVESYAGKRDEYQVLFELFPMADYEEQQFGSLMAELNRGLEQASIAQIEQAIAALDFFSQNCKKETLELLDKQKEEIETYDFSELLTAEKQMVNAYLSGAEEAFEKSDYRNAVENYEKCLLLLNHIEKAWNNEITVEQVDVSSFPEIKLYISAYDFQTGKKIDILEKYINLRETVSGIYQETVIRRVSKLDGKENLNVCLVADVSGSMWEQMGTVKAVMSNFLECMQYHVGDKASVISFDDYVNINMDFSGQKDLLKNEVNHMYVGNCTALYDALYVAVCNASRAEGAKCVVAFTDGYDNVSTKSEQDVINAARLYGVPIYLMGIGRDVDEISLQSLSSSTGGYYRNVFEGKEMWEIYNSIYQEKKELYLIEYTTNVPEVNIWHNMYLAYDDGNRYMRCEAEFLPNQLKATGEEYESLLQENSISNADIEDEVLRIRKVYNEIVRNRDKGMYTKINIGEGITGYLENGHVRCVIVPKGINGVQFSRFYYYENDQLIFAYIESIDSHRLYFCNEKMFRWRYASDAVNFSEADNHDNEDSAEFRTWESFALTEGKAFLTQ